MRIFPLFQKIDGKTFLIVGGGRVAAEKVGRLEAFGASMRVVGIWISDEIREMAAGNREPESGGAQIRIAERPFRESDLDGVDFCIVATDDNVLNRNIHDLCVERRIPVNVVDTMELCEFLFPSLVKRGDLTVAISTAGKSPAMARYMKKQVEEILPDQTEAILDRLGELRKIVPKRIPSQKQRGRAYTDIMKLLLATGNTASDEEIEVILSRYT